MFDHSTLSRALAGRYEIEREAGAGGMATVYLARDVRHARQVALKVLHPELAAALGPERFLAEIRTTANLQHPHILPLHDSGEAEGFLYYVMPFVAGESLRQRLERETQLPIDDAVRIARELLSALDYAHRHGIVHRDIKPENILLHDGAALVADFGIALAVQSAGGQRMTQTGLSLGTPHYMSPEQAMGEKNISGRADVYAAGAVLYEMLTGEPPFTGASVQAIVAKVMTERPMSPRTVRDTVPPHVEEAVMRALAKLPADRFPTAKDFSDALDGRGSTGAVRTDGAALAHSARTKPRMQWVLGGVAVGALAGIGAMLAWHDARTKPPEPMRFTVDPPAGMTMYDGSFRPFALSADGRSIVFAAGAKGALYLRRLNELRAVPIPNTEQSFDFQFSPDGEWLAFAPVNPTVRLKKLRLAGASDAGPETILPDSGPQRFAWTRSADIVYANIKGLWRRPAASGAKRLIAKRDTTDGVWLSPLILPDHRTVAFASMERGTSLGGIGWLRIASLDSGPVTAVNLEVRNVIGYANGFLIYGARDGRIMGVSFDLAKRKVLGEPVALVDNVVIGGVTGVVAALADNGTLAYLTGTTVTRVDIVNEHGVTLSTLPLEPRGLSSVNWSPDGTRVLLQSGHVRASDLYVYDTLTRVTTRLTRDGAVQLPRWTPDSKRVAWIAPGPTHNVVLWMPADGSALAEPIAVAKSGGMFTFSPDGKYIIVFSGYLGSGSSSPSTAYPFDGSAPIPLLADVKLPRVPSVSPNGKWMIYSSEEGERREVYLRPFPSGPGRVQLSTHGGDEPSWSHDGRSIFYRAPGSFHRATLDMSGALPRLVRDDSLFADLARRDFAVHPDGRRFALLRDTGEGAKLVIATHWLDEAIARLRGH